MAVHVPHSDRSLAGPSSIDRRALVLWPRLDRRALARCRHDLDSIARLVSHRTNLPIEAIRGLLAVPSISSEEGEHWFG